MSDVLRETNFSNLGKRVQGKVRDAYVQDDKIIFITTDRHSSFDRIIAHIPEKGAVLNLISAFWFEKTKDILPNQVIAIPDPNVTVAKKCELVPIEGVVRGYLTGTTDTAIWTRYQKGMRHFGGVVLPDGMTKNQRLPEPLFDPTTKESAHDRTLSKDDLIREGFVTSKQFTEVRETALRLFRRGQEIAESRGLMLVDTKYEFGTDEEGALTLIDEIHTPDSSRYWKLDSYEARIAEGKEPEYFDKEFLRLWFKEHSDPYKDEVLPEAPPEMVRELSRRYIEIFEQLTEKRFEKHEGDILARIEKNLEPYRM